MKTVAETVREILAEHTAPAIKPAELQLDSLLIDIGLDEFDKVEAVMDLEDALNLEISDDVSDTFKTVGDVVDFCEKKKVV